MALVLAASAAAGLAGFGPRAAVVRADQTVVFDGAGDAPHISLIGDSTLSGVRWYADYGALEQYNFVLSAESCRRTIEQSCISREGYRSQNVIGAMNTLDGQLGELLVIMSGYNDPVWTIDEAIEGVVDEARDQGVEHVVWLLLRTNDGVDYSDPQEYSSINTFREYNDQLVAAAEASDGFLQVADWATWSNGSSGWFEGDGVHLTPRGVDAVTTFIAGIVGRVLAGENVSPSEAPWTVLVPGAEGEEVSAVQEALVAAGIDLPGGADGVYGNDTMAAVAAYQRADGNLQVTGAVDIATARRMGVFEDPEAASTTTAVPTSTTAAPSMPATTIATAGAPVAADTASSTDDGASRDPGRSLLRWPLAAAGVLVMLIAAVAGRRRYVVARRASRRWARVHPSTAPGRSIADLRRSGELPIVPPPRRPASPVLYDHTNEIELAPVGDRETGQVPVTD